MDFGLTVAAICGWPLVAGNKMPVASSDTSHWRQLQILDAANETGIAELHENVFCSQTNEALKIRFDPFIHKQTYNIGVHSIDGLDMTRHAYQTALADYLTATAGKLFDPPIEFNIEAYYFDSFFDAIENEEMDFFFANPGVYSCVGTQVGATALATAVKRVNIRNRDIDLDVYGGVIAVRHDNEAINNINDIKDKIVAAGAIIDLMGGQMQIFEMLRNGMSHVLDPKQFIFTKDQNEVIKGVLSGRFDVGFFRTHQIEQASDDDGNPIDPNFFKIIEPKIYVMDNGELFPLLHSTDIFPQWPLASLIGVPADVQKAVQAALMDFSSLEKIGHEVRQCLETFNEEYCYSLDPIALSPGAPCYATIELGRMATESLGESTIAAWRSARSYFQLRDVQQRAGFLVQDERNNWYCTRPSNLYEGVTCPAGSFKRGFAEFEQGCAHVGLGCDDNPDYDCFCKPCVKAHEVDVYKLDEGEVDPHLITFFGEELPGCEKMSICDTIEQGEVTTLRIYDNKQRQNPKVEVVVHAGDQERHVVVKKLDAPFAYEFSITDQLTQVQVVDVLFDGVPVSQSPIRVVVKDKNCEAIHGVGSHMVSDTDGNCICAGNTYEMGRTCLESAYFFLIIFSAVFIALGVLVFFYLGYKKQQSDSVWHVSPDELHFNEPPEVIGQGGFGVVILGQYRGTKVAVKRVLPPSLKGKLESRNSGSISNSNSGERNLGSIEVASGGAVKDAVPKENKKFKSRRDRDNKQKNVKFDNAGDVESQTLSNSGDKMGSMSGSGRSLERLLTAYHSDNDVLRILESATASDHGSGTPMMTSRSASSTQVLIRMLPTWLRFDEHSRKVNEFVVEMRMLSRLRHPCITTVMGAVVSSTTDPMLVMEFMEYGSLYDLLHNETMTAGGEIILQIVRDIVQGVQFLHASKPPIFHGDLKAKNILVDSRFRAKVADFGFSHFKTSKQRNVLQGTPFYMAPEYLRRRTGYTTACDIYSFSMILYEIYARASPFDGEDPRKILPKVCHPRINKRPIVPASMPPKVVDLMKKCWSANSFFRPSAKDIDYVLVEMSSSDTEPLETLHDNIRDNVKQRKPTSLYDVFPKHIADALNAGKKVEAESHEVVTIVFSDIVGFTTISQRFGPMKVSKMLDRLYQAFDTIADKHNVFKVETIGDAYMGVTNLDGSQFDTHVKQVAEYAQDIIRASSTILIDEDDPGMGYVQIRVGFNSGPVVSNVIGTLNPRYGLFGDTVNTASRMEANSMPGRIHCSLPSAQLLQQQAPEIPLQLRGIVKVKGKGKMKTYWVGSDDLSTMRAPSSWMVPQEVSESHNEEDATSHVEEATEEKELQEILQDTDSISSQEELRDPDDEDISSKPDDDNFQQDFLVTSFRTHDTLSKSHRSSNVPSSDKSHATYSTQSVSFCGSRDSSPGNSKEHFIAVHCVDEVGRRKAQIRMDGDVVDLEDSEGENWFAS